LQEYVVITRFSNTPGLGHDKSHCAHSIRCRLSIREDRSHWKKYTIHWNSVSLQLDQTTNDWLHLFSNITAKINPQRKVVKMWHMVR